MTPTDRAALCCLAVLVALLAGCAERGTAAPASDVLGEWELTEGTAAGVPLPRPAAGRATLVVESGQQLAGVSYCNHYSGTYRLDGNALRIDGLGSTEMGCEPDVMAAESAYLETLAAASEARVDDEELVLTGDDATLRFRRVPPVPTSELAGTDWVLDTLVEGETVSSVASGSTLRLEADGTVRGTTVCRTFSGSWTAAGSDLTLTVVTDDPACPDELRRQDEHELAVLGEALTMEITENRLTVTGPAGDGLIYRDAGR